MRLLIRFALFLSISTSLAAQPFLGKERLVSPYGPDAPRVTGPFSVSAAGNADGFLVAWTETYDRTRVIGAQLSRDAKLIRLPEIIGSEPGFSTDVQWDGARYLVTGYGGDSAPMKRWQVSLNSVVPVAVTSGKPLVTNASGEHLSLDWVQGSFAFFYTASNGAYRTGALLAKSVPRYSTVLYQAAIGDDFVLLTLYGNSLQWVRVTRTGVDAIPVPFPPQTFEGTRTFSRIAVNGSSVSMAWELIEKLDYLAWPEYRRTLGSVVVNMETGAAAQRVADTMRGRLSPDAPSAYPRKSDAMFNGREFVYAWTRFDLTTAALDLRVAYGNGEPRIVTRFTGNFTQEPAPVLAPAGDRDLLLWNVKSGSRSDLVARVLTSSSSADDGTAPSMISNGVPRQWFPSVYATSRSTLVTWLEGEALAPMGRFGVPFGFASPAQVWPAIAAGADVFLHAWRSGSAGDFKLVLQRYDENGTPVDPQPVAFANATNAGSPAVVWDGSSFIAYWREYVFDEQKSVTFARRIPARGAVTASTVRVTDKEVTLYSAGGRVFAIWLLRDPGGYYQFQGARLRDNLLPETTMTLWLFQKHPATTYEPFFSIAGSDRELMISMSTRQILDDKECSRMRRIGLDLQPAGEIATIECEAGPADYRIESQVRWDGRQWWALTGDHGYYSVSYPSPLRLRRIEPNGNVREPMAVDLEHKVYHLTFAPTPGALTLAYTRVDEDGGSGTMRVFLRPVVLELPKARSARH